MYRTKTATAKITKAAFEEVGDVHNLYRCTGNNIYYALVRQKGKLHKRSLKTDDKATANRKLTDFQRDLGKADAS